MSEKFKDFPCFYYLNNRVDEKSLVQFYSMLASMFKQTPERAAQNSELFAHASGKLFGGVGFSVEKILSFAGTCFEKPYADCKGFYRRKAISTAKLKENCCFICPFSSSYANYALEHERKFLRVILTDRSLLTQTKCTVERFKSMLPLSCSNDMADYPAIPFNAYLFRYIVANENFDEGALVAFINDILVSNNQDVPRDVLTLFVSTQLSIINHVTLEGATLMSALVYSYENMCISKYHAPQIVRAVTEGAVGGVTGTTPRNSLSRLFADYDNMVAASKISDEERKKDTSNNFESDAASALPPSLKSLFAKEPVVEKVINNETVVPAEESKSLTDEDCLTTDGESKLTEENILVSCDVQVDVPVMEEDVSVTEAALSDNHIENIDISIDETEVIVENAEELVLEPAGENEDFSFVDEVELIEEVNEARKSEPEQAFVSEQVIDDVAEELSEVCDSENLEAQIVESEEFEISEHVSDAPATVTLTVLPDNVSEDNGCDSAFDDEEWLDDEPYPEPEPYVTENEDDSNVSINTSPCCICHGIAPAEYQFSSEWSRELYVHSLACESSLQEEKQKPFCSAALTHPQVSTNCAFSHDTCDDGCIYSGYPIEIPDEYISMIKDCSDYAGELINLVSFVEACENASYASVECVQMYGINGLLFLVSGSYYFIGGGTTAISAMKKVLSDSEKLKLFSINPILVHVAMLRFGMRRVKIESLAVLYSVFVGTDLLFPPSVIFSVDSTVEMYFSIMSQYEWLYNRIKLNDEEHKRYTKLQRLEWALASSVDTSFIAFGVNRSVFGSNALNYRFALFDVERICREGTLYIVTLDDSSKIPLAETKEFWEDVAGRLASSSLSCMNYAFLLGLGNGISYFTCFEEEAFFDSLMASARSAYKKAYKKEVHLQVVQERYITN